MIAETIGALLDKLRDRKKSYQSIFGPRGIIGSTALHDLSRFCRAFETCVVPGDEMMTKVLEGRREVWLRIAQHLHLEPEELAALYGATQVEKLGDGR